MASKQAVWGIDVGQCALKAIKIQGGADGVEVLDFVVIEHEKILSHPNVDGPASIRAAIEAFRAKYDTRGDRVVVGVPGQQTLQRFTKLPPVDEKQIPNIVNYEAKQQIPFDMDEVVWDYQTFSQPDSPDVDVGIFAIRKELIRNHIEYFSSAMIEPSLAQASPLALYNAWHFDRGGGDKATILLDIGAQTTDLIVVEGNSIWARPVPIGGNAFTEALVKGFKLSHSKAEQLKRTAASSKYARQIFQAMRPVFADLISEVQRSIGFYTATHRDTEIARIVGVGNAFKLPGLTKFINQNLQIEVERLSTFNKATLIDQSRAAEFNDAAGSLAVSFGLAVQGLGAAAISSSLLPPELIRQMIWRKKTGMFAASAACLLATAGLIWFSNASAMAKVSEVKTGGRGMAPSDVEQAQTYLTGAPPVQDPMGLAQTVVNSVNKMTSAYNTAKGSAEADKNSAAQFADLGKYNAQMARIVQAIHEGIEAEAPGLGASSGAEYMAMVRDAKNRLETLRKANVSPDDPRYQEVAKIAIRSNRNELWILTTQVEYFDDLSDVVSYWTSMDEQAKTEAAGRSGWRFILFCQTTRDEPEGWIDDRVSKTLLAAGRKPDLGFHFAALSLDPKPSKIRTADRKTVTSGAAGEGAGAAGVRGGGRAGGGTAGGSPRGLGGGLGGLGGPVGGPTGGPTGNDPTAEDERLKLKSGHDPLLPDEQWLQHDWDVTLDLLVISGDTPKRLLPKADKPAGEGESNENASEANGS